MTPEQHVEEIRERAKNILALYPDTISSQHTLEACDEAARLTAKIAELETLVKRLSGDQCDGCGERFTAAKRATDED